MRKLLAACSVALFAFLGQAQATPFPTIANDVGVCDPNNPTHCVAPDASGNMPVTGTFTATLGGFTPGLTFATLTATGSSASVALPAGATVVFQNTGTTAVSCTLGIGSATALVSEILVQPSSSRPVVVGTNTFGACIDQTGSVSNLVVLMGGSGLDTGYGGGGGSGGGGAVTLASGAVASGAFSAGAYAAGAVVAGAFVDGWDVTQGLKTDAACAGDNTSGCSVEARLQRIAQNLTTLNTTAGSSIPAGSAIIGKLGIDQTTPGTTNGVQLPTTSNGGAATVKGGVGVVNGGSTYQAVAASSTATVLQTSTGAIGDYLSHCDIYPTSTSPGVVTVFDNTNAAAGSVILFPGGASSVSNLVPFAVPVGAVSTAGAWKVTTGAAVSVVCYGKFS